MLIGQPGGSVEIPFAAVIVLAAAAVVVWPTPWTSASSTPALLETRPFTSYLGQEREPALSPDGSRVAFGWTGETGDNVDLYLKQTNTSGLLRLTEHPGFESSPAWSPDGTTIAFHDLATRTNRSVASIPNIASPSLEVSPDGRRLLYARIEQSNSDLIATTLR